MKDDFKKILVVRFSSLGDIVILTPIFRALRTRFPESQIDFLTKVEYQALVKYNPFLNKIWEYDSKSGLKGLFGLIAKLKDEGYELIIDMHNNIRTRIIKLCYHIPLLRFYKPRFKRFMLFYFWLDLFEEDFSLLRSYFKVLEPLGIEYEPEMKPEVFLPDNYSEISRAILSRNNIEGEYVVFLPIATWRNKLYPLEELKIVAERIKRELGLEIIWLGGKRDEQILKLQRGAKVGKILAGETSLLEALAILKGSKLVVGNDTGLTYAAEALGVPAILILGPTARQTGAGLYNPGNTVLEKDLWCRPCSQKGDRPCYRLEQFCFKKITPQEIFEAAKSRLGVVK